MATSEREQADENIPFLIRPLRRQDYAFLVDSYWRSRCDSERPSHRHALHKKYEQALNMLIVRGAEFRIAHFAEDVDRVLGWSCVEGPILHYVFVKSPYRQQGIAKALVFGRGGRVHHLWCSHWSVAATAIALAHHNTVEYIGIDPPKGVEVKLDGTGMAEGQEEKTGSGITISST